MIPPIEERRVRPCSQCGIDFLSGFSNPICSARKDDNTALCQNNFSPDELLQIIDQHNAGEQIIVSLVKEIEHMLNYAVPNPIYGEGFADALYRILFYLQQSRQDGE